MPRRAGKPVHSQNGLNEFKNRPFLNHALFEKRTTNILILNLLYSAFIYSNIVASDNKISDTNLPPRTLFKFKRTLFRMLIKQIVCDSYTIMDDDDEEREPVFLTPPSRIELRVGADATGMAGANLLDNYDLEENLDDDQYTLSDKIVHYVGGQIFPVHWNAVKIVLMFKSGCEVATMHTMTFQSLHTK